MIKINKNFIIDSDENQFIVKEVGTIQDKNSKNYGEETYNVIGYYGTLEQALHGLEKVLSRRAIKVKTYTLKKAIEEIRAIHEDIFKCVKGE
jgi:hypothetical protein